MRCYHSFYVKLLFFYFMLILFLSIRNFSLYRNIFLKILMEKTYEYSKLILESLKTLVFELEFRIISLIMNLF